MKEKFTFYFIYINTISLTPQEFTDLQFTFYFIYINTPNVLEAELINLYLHSTLFILIHSLVVLRNQNTNLFTFYFIYINTIDFLEFVLLSLAFTFYFIYINTWKTSWRGFSFSYLHSTLFILIQSCSCSFVWPISIYILLYLY